MERNTRQREAVLAAIEHAGRALTPGEILALAQETVASLNLSTIYRHINALQDEARIVKVLLPGQAARFEAACGEADHDHGAAQGGQHPQHPQHPQHAQHQQHTQRQGHHHHHFHCSVCDRVYALHACPGSMQELAPAGFLVTAHQITLRGLCAECGRRAAS